ncbi:ATP-binding cassette transporter snq2 [Mucor velutinosus]|uniref:ATP-binding cassette transporter snq2 n=1 Tax=Mucor velutinosus TaxID=708070 RepID=A0AAN7D9R4_9FUNG|nr:ATP-binding cassette transporter snq2 [Mucor velutinosus]
MNSNKLTFSTASFYTSFLSDKGESNSFGHHRQFLQSPLWKPISSTHQPAKEDEKKQATAVARQAAKNALQQAIYILPKSPSHVSIYLQLPKFRSLSVLMRCGHVSQLVENWLCNPMEQLKRNAEKNQHYRLHQQRPNRPRRTSSSAPLCIMPSSTTSEAGLLPVVSHENAVVPAYRKHESTVSVHFQIPHEQQEHMEIRYANVPCLFTVVCVTYHCGTVSLSVNQIDSLDFLLSPNTMNPFLVQCNLVPQHPVTVHQLVPSSSSVYHQQLQICDFEDVSSQQTKECPAIEEDSNEFYLNPEPRIRELHTTIQEDDEALDHQKTLLQTPAVELLHYKETLLYQQENDDDEASGMFTSDEDFSLIDEEDDIPEDGSNYHYHKARSALLELVQDTLQYIESSGGALTDELNNLAPKLFDYCSSL